MLHSCILAVLLFIVLFIHYIFGLFFDIVGLWFFKPTKKTTSQLILNCGEAGSGLRETKFRAYFGRVDTWLEF